MPSFMNKVKTHFQTFHLEQPGVGPGVGGQHGGVGANEVYTSSSGNRWEDNAYSRWEDPASNKRAPAATSTRGATTSARTSSSS